MGLFDEKSKPPKDYSAVKVEFTKDELDAISHALRRWDSIINSDAPEGMTAAVPQKMIDAITAKGLVEYVEDLMGQLRNCSSNDETAIVIDKAIKAQTKAYAVHNLPVYLFQAAKMLELVGDVGSAKQFFRQFLESQDSFRPDKIDSMFLRRTDLDIPEMVEMAERVLISEPESTRESELKRSFAETHDRVETENKPLLEVGLAIARAATNCRDQTKALIRASTEEDRVEREIYVFFEFIYFFMHLTMHRASSVLSKARLELLQDFLVMTIPSTAIDSYFHHWPGDLKQNMIGEFVERLNEREAEYSTVITWDASLKGVERSAARLQVLFSKVARSVSSIALDDEYAVREVLQISQFTLAEWIKMRLDTLFAKVAEIR